MEFITGGIIIGISDFKPIHLGLTLPKGFAKEYKNRDWFNQIYFSNLSMYHGKEGYIPILYDFNLEHESEDIALPQKILMTFYYPRNRISNLNGIVIIGGEPDIYSAYQTTRVITPHLESLLIDKYDFTNKKTEDLIDETLYQLLNPQRVKDSIEIVGKSYDKSGDELNTFYPILADSQYQKERLALPLNFMVDAIFMIKIRPDFFTTNQIGEGIISIKMYQRESVTQIKPKLAYPLIFKWQPIYNDILSQLKKRGHILPLSHQGKLIPNVVMFEHHDDNENTALFSTLSKNGETYYLHVAVARSGYIDGQPISLVHAALKREKFGQDQWLDRIDKMESIPEDSIRNQEYTDDLITTKMIKVVDETELTINGNFDLGILNSIELN